VLALATGLSVSCPSSACSGNESGWIGFDRNDRRLGKLRGVEEYDFGTISYSLPSEREEVEPPLFCCPDIPSDNNNAPIGSATETAQQYN
jgi:hypothetical protein